MTGYSTGFSGFMSTGKGGTQDIANRVPGSTHHRHGVWPKVLKEIIAFDTQNTLPQPLCLFGHSMGAEAVLEICAGLAKVDIEVDYAGIVDLTLETPWNPNTLAGGNIKLLQEFHSAYKHVEFKGFTGKHELFELDDIMDDNIGHSQAAHLDFTQNKIVETIAMLTKSKVVSKFPVELNKMVIDAGKSIDPANETPEQTKFNQVFFNSIRPQFGSISPNAIDGMKMIIHAFDTYFAPKGYDDHLLAFVLGNVFNETGKRMVPVRETNAKTHAGAMAALDRWWASGKAKKAGVKNKYWADGYYGRGLFQETHFGNYSKGSVLWEKWFTYPLDFVKTPDLYLNPIVSALSAFIGSIEGKYTGKKFGDYCDNDECDFAEARRMINGDRNLRLRDVDGDGLIENMGDEIGQVCEAFYEALTKARGANNAHTLPVPVEPPKLPVIELVGDLDDARANLEQYFPDLNSQNRDLVLALAIVLGRRPDPPDISQIGLPTNPPKEAGFSLPQQTKGNGMFNKTFNFKSKTTLTGMFSVLAGFAMFVLPEGNMLLELARSIYPAADPGTLITGGLAIVFAREAIAKNGAGK